MEMLQGVWKQHLRPRAVVGYGVKIFLPSPPNYVTRSPGKERTCITQSGKNCAMNLRHPGRALDLKTKDLIGHL